MALVVTSAPFQQVNMPALDLRRTVGVGRTEGVVAGGDMAVAQRAAGANLSVDVAAGEAFVQGDSITNQGLYYAYNDAVFNLTGFTASNATLPRIDRVALRIRDAFHGDAANDEAFVVLTGTATAGATLANLTGAPAVPGSHLLLANVRVAAAATSIPTGDIDTTARVRSIPLSGALFDTILSAAAATIDIPGIPANFAHLLIVVYAHATVIGPALTGLNLRFNNDATANYDYQYQRAQAASSLPGGTFTANSGQCGLASGSGNTFDLSRVLIPYYAGTANNKTYEFQTTHKHGTASGDMEVRSGGGFWRSNAAINRITFILDSGSFDIGTRLTIYAMGA